MARTQYAIRRTSDHAYVSWTGGWVYDRMNAMRFDFMTTAIGFAIELGMSVDEFEVEAI